MPYDEDLLYRGRPPEAASIWPREIDWTESLYEFSVPSDLFTLNTARVPRVRQARGPVTQSEEGKEQQRAHIDRDMACAIRSLQNARPAFLIQRRCAYRILATRRSRRSSRASRRPLTSLPRFPSLRLLIRQRSPDRSSAVPERGIAPINARAGRVETQLSELLSLSGSTPVDVCLFGGFPAVYHFILTAAIARRSASRAKRKRAVRTTLREQQAMSGAAATTSRTFRE